MNSIINGYDALLGLSTEIEQVEAQHQDQFDSVDQMYDRASEQLPDADVQSSVDQVQLDQSLAELADHSQQASQSESEHGESGDTDPDSDHDTEQAADVSPKSDQRQLQQPMSERIGQHIDLPDLPTQQSSLNPIVTHQGEMNQSVNRAAQPGALVNSGFNLADQLNHSQVQTIGHGVDQVRVRKSPPIDQSEGAKPLSAGVSALQHDVGSKQEQIDRTVESLALKSDDAADAKPETDTAAETKAKAKAEPEPKPKPEIEAESRPETTADAKPETKAESQLVSQPQIKVVTPTITINRQLVNLADLPQTLTGDVTLAYDQQNNQVQIEFTKRHVAQQQDQQLSTQQRSDDQQHTDRTEHHTLRTRKSSAQSDEQRFVDSLNVIRQQFNSKHQDTKIQPIVRVDAVAQPVASYLIRTDQPVATDKQCLVVLHQYLNQHPQVAKAAIYASAVSVHISQLTQPMKLSIGSLSLLSLKQAQTAIKLDFAQ